MSEADMLAELLSEGLDLCVRARELDTQTERSFEVQLGRIFPEGTRCATPALWIQRQYDDDLTAWEERAKSTLLRLGYAR